MKNSDFCYRKALQYIPEGAMVKSKMACRYPDNFPKFISHGSGSHIWDVDGNEYVDWVMGLGPVILGYADPDVSRAVREQMMLGNVFPLPSPKEAELAELLSIHIPCAEMSRFARNGADATMGAVRLARAITEKEVVLYCGYHGGADWYAHEIVPNSGTVSQPVTRFEFNNIDTLIPEMWTPAGVAAIIMEVPPEEQHSGFINRVINMAHEHDSLFILDEVVTGFRYSMGGAQELLGLDVDLACFSKGMANGFPISAVCGKRKYMQHFKDIFFSTTFGGELTGIAAAIATINKLYIERGVEQIWKIGDMLRTGIRDLGHHDINFELKGNPARSLIVFKNEDGTEDLVTKSVFLQEVIKRGVFMGVPIFPCVAHTEEDVEQTIFAIGEAFHYIWKHRNDPDKGLVGEPIRMTGLRKS